MTMTSTNGQGLVEAALVLPVLLLLLAGSYVCCRAAFLHSAAESAAQTEAIRTGRQLAGIEGKMADAILPHGRGVVLRAESAGRGSVLPAPFPSLAGRTKGIAEIRHGWEEGIGIREVPSLQVVRLTEASVDCWEKKTGSGKKIRNFIKGLVAVGVLR